MGAICTFEGGAALLQNEVLGRANVSNLQASFNGINCDVSKDDVCFCSVLDKTLLRFISD